jgi:hypothetical protein
MSRARAWTQLQLFGLDEGFFESFACAHPIAGPPLQLAEVGQESHPTVIRFLFKGRPLRHEYRRLLEDAERLLINDLIPSWGGPFRFHLSEGHGREEADGEGRHDPCHGTSSG